MRRVKGFTLIELLVVISIIAVLMSIMMPALGRVREQAKRISCGNNVKQISLGLNLYCNDYDNKIPCDTASVMTLGGRAGEFGNSWSKYALGSEYRLLNPYCGGPYETKKQFGSCSYSEYMDADSDTPLFKCPSDKGDPAWDNCKNSYESFGSSYVYNVYWSENGTIHPTLNGKTLVNNKYIGLKAEKIQNPSKVIFAGDNSLHNYYGGGDRQMRWHDKKKCTANAVFVDCHVEYVEVERGHTTSNYTFLPTKGWLRD